METAPNRDEKITLAIAGYGLWEKDKELMDRMKEIILDFVDRLEKRTPEYELEILGRNINRDSRQVPYTRRKFENRLKDFFGGRSAGISIFQQNLGVWGKIPYQFFGRVNLYIGYWGDESSNWKRVRREDFGNYFELQFVPELVGDLYSEAELIGIFKELCIKANAATGFIDRTHFMIATERFPNEDARSVEYTYKHHKERLRGYSWMIWMTEGHIKRMGGIEECKRKLGEERVKTYTMKNGERALCFQANEKIGKLTEEERLKIKQVLKPIIYKDEPTLQVGYYDDYRNFALAYDEEEKKEWEWAKHFFATADMKAKDEYEEKLFARLREEEEKEVL